MGINEQGQVYDVAYSAAQYVEQTHQLPVIAIATLNDLLEFLHSAAQPEMVTFHAKVFAYRQKYGVVVNYI